MDKPVRGRRIGRLIASKRVRLTRLRVVLSGSVIALLGIGGVVGYHQYSWNQHAEYTETTYVNARTNIEALFNGEDIDAKDIGQISNDATSVAKSLCAMPFLGDMRQRLVESARHQHEACRADAESLKHVAKAANALRGRIDIEQKLAVIYKDTQQSLLEAKDYQTRPQIWRQTKEKIVAIAIDESYQEPMESQLAAIDVVIASYGKLTGADKSKKRSEFDQATKELQEVYDALGSGAVAVKNSYQSLVLDLAGAIEAL